jgi:2-dehydropantoate 2-reductase
METAGYCTHWQRAAEFIEAFYDKLVPDTAEHESSMLQDILAGRRTEIDALTGAVIELARRRGRGVPYNHAIYDLVKFVEGTHS